MSEPTNVTKTNNNVIIMVIVGVVVLLILCMCCFIPFMTVALLGNSGSQSSNNDYPQISPSEKNTEPGGGDIQEYQVGDVVELNDFSYVVNGYEDPFVPTTGGTLLEDEKLVAVYIEVTNSSQFSTYLSSYDWVLKDEDENTYYTETFDNYKEPLYSSKTLEPAETNSGWITFAVPVDVTSLSLVSNVTDGYSEVVLY